MPAAAHLKPAQRRLRRAAVGGPPVHLWRARGDQHAYDPAWGRFKAVTHPVPGNHEYETSGGTGCSTNAAGYLGYFGEAAGEPGKGYYSYDIGS